MSDLSQERLDFLLSDAPLGNPCWRFATVGSTQDVALEWARSGAPHGALVLAEAQTLGRGRRGRSWDGGENFSLLLSFILRPELPKEAVGLIGGAAVVALARAVRSMTGLPARTKWPNDLWIGDRKAAGILPEAVWQEGRLEAVAVGIGVNVNQESGELPQSPRIPATSLRLESGCLWDRGELLRALCFALHEAWGWAHRDLPRLLSEWEALERTLGESIVVEQEGRRLEGISKGICPDGGLRLLAGGRERHLRWGEATFRISDCQLPIYD